MGHVHRPAPAVDQLVGQVRRSGTRLDGRTRQDAVSLNRRHDRLRVVAARPVRKHPTRTIQHAHLHRSPLDQSPIDKQIIIALIRTIPWIAGFITLLVLLSWFK